MRCGFGSATGPHVRPFLTPYGMSVKQLDADCDPAILQPYRRLERVAIHGRLEVEPSDVPRL